MNLAVLIGDRWNYFSCKRFANLFLQFIGLVTQLLSFGPTLGSKSTRIVSLVMDHSPSLDTG